MADQDAVLSPAQIAERLDSLPGWTTNNGWMIRTYRTRGWPTTLMLVNAIGFAAEAADHHPDLEVSWSRVVVRLQTHSAGGVTSKDTELARVIENTALWQPTGSLAPGTREALVRGEPMSK